MEDLSYEDNERDADSNNDDDLLNRLKDPGYSANKRSQKRTRKPQTSSNNKKSSR